jgi:3',5'-cyclic AMP phosphodiesterase CpdA
MKLALIADLHFGSVPRGLAEQLRDTLEQAAPELIVIAGDFTLRARRSEFAEAKNWLNSLTIPALILPGNHDLPYWNLLQRFADPYHRFHQAGGADTLMPTAELPDAYVLGFNTTASWQPHLRWQEGVARERDMHAAEAALSALGGSRFKAVAAHHPFIKVPGMPRARPVRNARRALQAFAASGVELLMSGHTHQSFAIQTEIEGRKLLSVGAPTALSRRMRGEANGFWVIETEKGGPIVCTLFLRNGSEFAAVSKKEFHRDLARAVAARST